MTTTPPDPPMLRAQALKLYGLLAHWEDIAEAAWVAPPIAWEEKERVPRGLERRLGNAHLGRFEPSQIPEHRSPQAARAVYELIDSLQERI